MSCKQRHDNYPSPSICDTIPTIIGAGQ